MYPRISPGLPDDIFDLLQECLVEFLQRIELEDKLNMHTKTRKISKHSFRNPFSDFFTSLLRDSFRKSYNKRDSRDASKQHTFGEDSTICCPQRKSERKVLRLVSSFRKLVSLAQKILTVIQRQIVAHN